MRLSLPSSTRCAASCHSRAHQTFACPFSKSASLNLLNPAHLPRPRRHRRALPAWHHDSSRCTLPLSPTRPSWEEEREATVERDASRHQRESCTARCLRLSRASEEVFAAASEPVVSSMRAADLTFSWLTLAFPPSLLVPPPLLRAPLLPRHVPLTPISSRLDYPLPPTCSPFAYFSSRRTRSSPNSSFSSTRYKPQSSPRRYDLRSRTWSFALCTRIQRHATSSPQRWHRLGRREFTRGLDERVGHGQLCRR